jgi:hypothetical protein
VSRGLKGFNCEQTLLFKFILFSCVYLYAFFWYFPCCSSFLSADTCKINQFNCRHLQYIHAKYLVVSFADICKITYSGLNDIFKTKEITDLQYLKFFILNYFYCGSDCPHSELMESCDDDIEQVRIKCHPPFKTTIIIINNIIIYT